MTATRVGSLHVGLDIDGVLADYMSAIADVGRAHGHSMTGAGHGPTQYGLVEPGWFPDEKSAHAAMAELRNKLGKLDLLDHGAPEAVRRLRAAGHRVDIVTARHSRARRCTAQWLDRHGFEYEQLRFETAKHVVGCDIYIDDAAHNVMELREAGHVAVIYDAPYNRHVGGLRVTTMEEFVDLILHGQLSGRAS
ncbi:5' nucleotidase, NT5C type [Mycolicibacterium aubagnense]|uniref:5'-nucleotidase n=1 Tax=Mycolicibacterium aubagnense TaxID=319707 RepID=A0ABM7I6N4_9MYCO|nr:hypothetical protein [Mycolicibacterium aubagnense]TLH48981.1 hypothetical protein C1S80_29300 [Mycolicibacterium aubagnense]BBX82233.1 hypothetical protein MAUB_01060 [Mycolicibacterium aubagnense]